MVIMANDVGIPSHRAVRRDVTSRTMLVAVLVFANISLAAAASSSVSYSTTVADDTGVARTVTFQGTASGSALSGAVAIDGNRMAITGTIANDGSVSGQFAGADGKRLGVFWGQRVGAVLKGSYDLGGKVGSWTVPANKLPLPK